MSAVKPRTGNHNNLSNNKSLKISPTTVKAIQLPLNPCMGVGLKLHDRQERFLRPNLFYGRHPVQPATHAGTQSLLSSFSKHDDWISEHIYRKYAEADSRPESPTAKTAASIRYRVKNSKRKPRNQPRKCLTPEPEFHFGSTATRRVLILDLRKLKSVDATITRQDSLTSTATLSGMETDEQIHDAPAHDPGTKRSATRRQNRKQVFRLHQLPVAYERSTSPKILEEMTFPPLHASVLTLLSQGSAAAQGFRSGMGEDGSATKQKKLRRQGRRRKSNSRDSDDKEGGHGGNDAEGSGNNGHVNRYCEIEATLEVMRAAEEIPATERTMALYEILDKRLAKERWYITEDHMIQEIEQLEKLYGKTEKRLRQLNLDDTTSLLRESEPKKRITVKTS